MLLLFNVTIRLSLVHIGYDMYIQNSLSHCKTGCNIYLLTVNYTNCWTLTAARHLPPGGSQQTSDRQEGSKQHEHEKCCLPEVADEKLHGDCDRLHRIKINLNRKSHFENSKTAVYWRVVDKIRQAYFTINFTRKEVRERTKIHVAKSKKEFT